MKRTTVKYTFVFFTTTDPFRLMPVFLKQLDSVATSQVVNTKNALQRIQMGLQKRQFYKGKIDGVFGPATWNAVRNYERGKKRPPLGLPTTALLKELELAAKQPRS